MPGKPGYRPSLRTKELHRQRTEERKLARLREEVEAAEQSYNGRGEAQVVIGYQLAKVLQEWRDMFDKRNEGFDPGRDKIMGPIDWLKEMTGLHVRRIHGLVKGEFPIVGLSQAELVLMAIDKEQLLDNGTIHVIPNPNWSLEKWTTYMEERGCI